MVSNMAAISEGNNFLFSPLQTHRGQQNTPPYHKTSSSRAKVASLVVAFGAASSNNGQQEEGHLQVDQHRGKETQGTEGRQVERSGQRRPGGGALAGAAGRRRGDIPSLLLDTWDPFSHVGGLSRMMDVVDQWFLDNIMAPWPAAGVSAVLAGVRTPWDVVEDEEAFHIRVDVPGFGKEDVKVAVEDGEVLVISGQRDSLHEDQRWVDKSYSNFNTRLTLPDNAQDDQIKAELKNGVLCLTVPKCKPADERKQVIDVQVT